MMKTFGIALCVILFAFVYFVQAENDGYTYVVQRLNKFQTSSGGFKLRESDTSESLEATADAIFLASLFGLKEEINIENVAKYLNSLRNPDFGFGKNPGNASNLEATSQVISCSKHIKGTISLDNVAAFVKSKLQGHSGLFGSLKSTVFAVQIMNSLNSSESWYKKDVRSDVLKYLSTHRVNSKSSGDSSFSFHAETSLSAIEANYYGILLGRLVGFDFGDLAAWGKFIHKFQNADGGFRANPSDKASSIDAAANALASLRLLQSPDVDHSSSLNFINSHISVDALSSYLTSSTPRDLSAVAGAHLAIALTNKFVSNFQTDVSYVGISGEVSQRIIQGSKIRPVLSILSLGKIPHRGLSVQASTLLNNHKPPSKLQLASPILDVKESVYSSGSDYLDTSDILGVLKFVFNVTLELPQPLGSVSFQIIDEKKIGFGLLIDSDATLPDVAKREFEVGDVVALETQFDFKLNLFNKSDSKEKVSDKILNGNFFVVFSLLDSSGVVIHREAKDCKKNSAPLEFQYKLTSSNIPAGELTFRFDVADNADVGTVPHTTENQVYRVAFPMVASEIHFYGAGKDKEEKREFKIGETVNVRIQPASFQDLQTPNPYSGKNVLGENIGNKRNFVMDVKSPGGVLLRTVNGISENNKYVFPLKIEPSLDLIGTNVVSFKYKASNGEIIELGNFDVESGNLVEDTSLLNFTVKAALQMVSSSFGIVNNSQAYYGNLVELRFKLLDSKSGVHINNNANEESDRSHANVYLELKHKSDNRPVPFVSDVEAAQADTEEHDPQLFVIKWEISPNAVKGPGELTVSVKGADGNIVPIYDSKSGNDVRYKVDIGGEIESDAKVYSVARINKDKTAFVVTFKLECNDKVLRDAQLRCSVVDSSKHHKLVTNTNNKNKKVKGEEKEEGVLIRGVPVANSGDVYSVSWALPHEEVHSGNYYLRCYRETDRKRTVEDREFLLKKKRHDALSKRELEGTDEKIDEEDEVDAADIEDEMEPLFIIEIEHVGVISRFFVRPELLLALLAGAAFFALSYRKKKYVTN